MNVEEALVSQAYQLALAMESLQLGPEAPFQAIPRAMQRVLECMQRLPLVLDCQAAKLTQQR